MRAVRRQSDQVDTTGQPGKEFPDIWPFMVDCIVPDDVDQALVWIVRFDLGGHLRGDDPVDSGWLNKGRIEGFKVERAMDVHAASPCGGWDGGV